MAFFEDIVDKVTRKLGQAFLRNPGDTANMGDVANPIRTDPTGTTPQPISGTVAATQSGAWAVTANAGTNLNTSLLALDSTLTNKTQFAKLTDGTNTASVSATGAVKVDGSAAIQPVSGTVTANAGTNLNTSALALDATLTNKTQFSKITDGTNAMSVSAASAAKVDGSAVTQPVSGTVTVTQATAANLKVDLSGTAANATAIKVDGSAATQPVSGTVTANIGTTNGLALDATLTGGTQKTKLVDTGGVNVATVSVAGAVKVDGSAVTQPVSGTFFQATQPVSAAALPLPAGASTAAKQPALGTAGTASADVITVQGIASMTALKVDGSAVTQPVSNAALTNLDVALSTRLKPADTLTAVTTVSTVTAVTAITNALPTGANSIGQVTANAGTNLNTSALALDATLTKLPLAQGSTTAAQSGPLIQGAVTTSAPAYTTAQTSPLSLTTAGELRTRVAANQIATYSASFTGLATALLATDIFVITGSGTKTVKIHRMSVTATRNTSSAIDIVLLKRSTDDTVGTSTTATNVPKDSNDAAGTAVVRGYTANPTLGTLIGNVRAEKMFVNAPAIGASDRFILNYEFEESRPSTLRGAAQILAINLAGVTITGGSFDFWVEWTEE